MRCSYVDVVYASNSPIIVDGGKGWNQDVDAASEKSWFQTFSSSVGSILLLCANSSSYIDFRLGTSFKELSRSLGQPVTP
jgi:hypothetical protein